MPDETNTQESPTEESQSEAEEAVAATTDSYGGPVSDEELADVYLPPGQDEVKDTGAPDASAPTTEPSD